MPILSSSAKNRESQPHDIAQLPFRSGSEGWYKTDLRYRGLTKMMTTGVMNDMDCVSIEELERSPYYREFLERDGLKWFAGVGFKAGDDFWALSIQRSIAQGAYQRGELDDLVRLWRPFSDAATLSKRLSDATLHGVTFGLETVGHAAMTCDHRGRICQVNSQAIAFLGRSLGAKHQIDLDIESRRQFDTMLGRAISPSILVANETFSCKVVLGGRPVRFRTVRLLGQMRYFFSQASVLILMKEEQAAVDVLLKEIYHLSPAEIRVTMALASGLAVQEIAQTFSIKASSVRAQLKAVFAKTETRNQAQLVSLVGRLRS